MAKEFVQMRSIRETQRIMRETLKNRETTNKAIRAEITPIWTADREKRSKRLEELTNALIEGRAKVNKYQKDLRELKHELKSINRAYDLKRG
jgi:hypothetical protein